MASLFKTVEVARKLFGLDDDEVMTVAVTKADHSLTLSEIGDDIDHGFSCGHNDGAIFACLTNEMDPHNPIGDYEAVKCIIDSIRWGNPLALAPIKRYLDNILHEEVMKEFEPKEPLLIEPITAGELGVNAVKFWAKHHNYKCKYAKGANV